MAERQVTVNPGDKIRIITPNSVMVIKVDVRGIPDVFSLTRPGE